MRCIHCGTQLCLGNIYFVDRFNRIFCTVNCAHQSLLLERKYYGADPRQSTLDLKGEKDAAV